MTDETSRKIQYYRLVPVYEPKPGGFNIASAAIVTCMVTGEALDGMGGGGMFVSKGVVDHLKAIGDPWRDRQDEHSAAITATHPCIDKSDPDRWNRDLRAREIVNNRHSKGALIDAMRWLLIRAERSEAALLEIDRHIESCIDGNDVADSVKAPDGASISGDLAGQIISWVRSLQEIARKPLNLVIQGGVKAA